MERRNFIKSGCTLCLLGATGALLPLLESCAPSKSAVYKTAVEGNKVIVPVSLFQNTKLQLVRPQGWFYDIAVHHNDDNTYSAMLMKCTHMDNQLNITGDGFTCSMHGSQFDKEGKVTKGPAETSLARYTVTVQNETLIINV